ncbi:MAG TPA: globin family protein [Methylomirabilota bacterium]|nr:globin family protein [Methylomirabilota bacterium]
MALTSDMIMEIRRSWALVARDADGAMDLFYRRLFEIAPETRKFFAVTDMAAQKRKLAASLGLVVKSADALAYVVRPLRDLGRRHVDYGVSERHYAPVGAALIATLEEGLGADFNDLTRRAWSEAYAIVVGVMLEGAATADRKLA